jgi:hypothetical protein
MAVVGMPMASDEHKVGSVTVKLREPASAFRCNSCQLTGNGMCSRGMG